MSNNNLLLVAAAGAAFYLMSKKAAAAAPVASSNPIATNVNNQMWSSILGGAWKSLVNPDTTGSTAFLMRNNFGQVVSSDGKPVDSIFSDVSDTISTGGIPGVDVSASDGTDWLSTMGW